MDLCSRENDSCGNGGDGWFHFFDPRPIPPHCQTSTAGYWVALGAEAFAVIDAAEASRVSESVATLGKIPSAAASAWLLTHRPLGIGTDIRGDEQPALPSALSPPGHS